MVNTNICAVGITRSGKWEIGIQQRMAHAGHGISGVMGNMPKVNCGRRRSWKNIMI